MSFEPHDYLRHILVEAEMPRRRVSSVFGQGDELFFVAGDLGEAAFTPVALGSFDALLRARYEVPPDVARTVQGLAADEHEACGDLRSDHRGAAWSEQRERIRTGKFGR